MAGIHQLQKHFLDYVDSLFNEEVLDEQFIEVQGLKPVDNPNFTVQLFTIFSDDAMTVITVMAEMLKQPTVNFIELYHTGQKLRGSSATLAGYVRQLHYEISTLKSKLESFFHLEKQIQDAVGEVPPIRLRMGYNLENLKPA
uniref:Histidine-containing phosphotransfer protein n=1 Tax=Kalanchoe fedtschenkoi TaxID=63787 RepID=A0A7N0ZRX6_KALFE